MMLTHLDAVEQKQRNAINQSFIYSFVLLDIHNKKAYNSLIFYGVVVAFKLVALETEVRSLLEESKSFFCLRQLDNDLSPVFR